MLCKFKSLSLFISLEIDSLYVYKQRKIPFAWQNVGLASPFLFPCQVIMSISVIRNNFDTLPTAKIFLFHASGVFTICQWIYLNWQPFTFLNCGWARWSWPCWLAVTCLMVFHLLCWRTLGIVNFVTSLDNCLGICLGSTDVCCLVRISRWRCKQPLFFAFTVV